ncbi:MAG: AbgT family transporter [Anaeromyxobacter sp.]|nr:AbgT family transporter [Anaeromyxobacter sp.]MBL0274825.1 AbgT family transporter [Anaeromyxobacter sp.]
MLPEPPILFATLALVVALVSGAGAALGWSVQPVRPERVTQQVAGPDGAPRIEPVLRPDGRPEVTLVPAGPPVAPRSLLSADGVYWALSSMLRNFTSLPALGLIFVAIIGIGVAERFGFFSALMRSLALRTPRPLLTPAVVLIGSSASVASDAGYVILPPLAAALYAAVGRHPVAGLAAAFAGVAGGFGAGFFPTGGDAALAGFAQEAARVVDPGYTVTILHNAWFKAASAVVVTLAGWWVTDRVVEPRLRAAGPLPASVEAVPLGVTAQEASALRRALLAMAAVLGLFAALIFVPGLPLHGPGQPTLPSGRALAQVPVVVAPPDGAPPAGGAVLAREPLLVTAAPGGARLVEPPGPRWSQVIVPLVFLAFLVPGAIYGRRTGALRTQKDLADALFHGVRSVVPVLVISFFMAQFVAWFAWSNLDRMLASAGGALLAQAHLPPWLLLALFVPVVVAGDFALSGMLSKFGALSPIFIPMFMLAGISPEATTAAYRVGDSVVNVVTPLNSYLLVVLAVLQKYRPAAGIGSLAALMLPYSAAFGLAWTALLMAWVVAGADLGPAAPILYLPP